MEKYYILHYPSFTGMGSDFDFFIVSDVNIRKIIRRELEKKHAGKGFDERFTGTWNEEKFCKSPDIEKQIENVLQKRLTTCSTYAGVNDLIELPSEFFVKQIDEHYNKRIFRMFNQFGYRRDIIVGSADFYRYILDFGNRFEEFGVYKPITEFTDYTLNNVLENHYMDNYKSVREKSKAQIEHANEVNRAKEFKGIWTERQRRAWMKEMKSEARANLEKFRKIPKGKDVYLWHLNKEDSNKYYKTEFDESYEQDKTENLNFVEMAYEYPLFPETLFCEVEDRTDVAKYYSYGELFISGANMQMLAYTCSGCHESLDDLKKFSPSMALQTVFG